MSISVKDYTGHTICIDDKVSVVVGRGTVRPGVVLNLTKKNVLVRFVWGNGRQTDRRFKVDQDTFVVKDVAFEEPTDEDEAVFIATLNEDGTDYTVSIDDDAIKALAAKAWATHPNNPEFQAQEARDKAPINLKRQAIIEASSLASGPRGDLVRRVQAYLPGNYEVRVTETGDVRVIGNDRLGWTLDGYVIPRLASGLIFAKEVVR